MGLNHLLSCAGRTKREEKSRERRGKKMKGLVRMCERTKQGERDPHTFWLLIASGLRCLLHNKPGITEPIVRSSKGSTWGSVWPGLLPFFKLEDQRTGMLSGPRVTRQLEIPEPECSGLHAKCPSPKARVEAQTPSAPQSSNLWEVIGSWRSVLLNGLHHGWAHSLVQMFRGDKLCYEVHSPPPFSSPSFSPHLLPFLHLPPSSSPSSLPAQHRLCHTLPNKLLPRGRPKSNGELAHLSPRWTESFNKPS